MSNKCKSFNETDILRPVFEDKESKKKPILSYRRLNTLEKIIFKFNKASGNTQQNKCYYDHTKLVLYKAFVKRLPPIGAKDLDLIDWFMFGECERCGKLYTISTHVNVYYW